ncbi:phosphonoacetaldehyde reductase [Orrella sp. 11846]|uniref:phosphonoacetaldehyde reductase n=1 Tax=Orrella sp. 11846 TaxID=3409913 RepID=UPI003B5A14CA
MSEKWTYFNPVRIVKGAGNFERVGEYARTWIQQRQVKTTEAIREQTWLLITTEGSTRRGLTKRLLAQFTDEIVHVFDRVTPNPELDDLEALINEYASVNITGIIALGGGSALDAAKVLSVTLPSEPRQSLRDILTSSSQDWTTHLPVITLPTTAGTGSEVTPFATVWDSTTHKKYSVTGDAVYPALAILDPTLTLSLPHQETLYTGLDATSHALESLWNRNATPISQAYAATALEAIVKAFPIALSVPDNLEARASMLQASMLAGLAISQTRTALAHSISYPVTSHFGVPHGLACSFTLPVLLEDSFSFLPEGYRPLLKQVQKLLLNLKLDREIRKYVDDTGLLALQDGMYTPDRAGNYIGEVCLTRILKKSL